ncbi:MAG TPA: hypothetical protein DCZ23_04560 [Lachnospiraceae bacterium]|nr:hypothetical protein [Lachnospiraceae bacterium]
MMKMISKAFAKKLFGAKYERLPQALLINLIVFWGLYMAGFQIQIAPSVRFLMISTFTAGVMWQALCSKDNAIELKHMLMLPFYHQEFVFSYVAMLGAYTILTKTGLLFAVLLAVSVWKPAEITGMAICMVNAVLMAAAVYSIRKYWHVGGLWTAAIVAVILLFGNRLLFGLLLLANSLFAVIILWRADGYAFYQWESTKSHAIWHQKRVSMLWYFLRYLGSHKNYLLNTVVMWCVALVLSHFLGEMAGLSVIPVGFAILSLNTPVCILLSCDTGLEQAVHCLPGQKKAFCIPYCLFISLCNIAADVIFLLSWQVQNSDVTVQMAAGAVFFSLQSAVLSVLLEWFYPIRDWKIESDLWHHPRKYIVPVVMLLLAGAVSAWPVLLYVLIVLLALETAVLFFI